MVQLEDRYRADNGKILFWVDERGSGWSLKITKPVENRRMFPKPDIIMDWLPGNDKAYDSVRISFSKSEIVMRANRFPYETQMVGETFWGYDPLGRRIICFDEMNSRIYVNYRGFDEKLCCLDDGKSKCFCCDCGPDKISFWYQRQVVMEMAPTFCCDLSCRIEGWIDAAFLHYLPCLSGLLAYQRLVH